MKNRLLLRITIIVLYFATFNQIAVAQKQQLHYTLIRGTDTVGALSIIDFKASGKQIVQTSLEAVVPTMAFNINVNDKKSVIFDNGILISAIVSRKVFNGRCKYSTTLLKNNRYTDGQDLIDELETTRIEFSLALLYTQEPAGLELIYSEFHQQMIPVEQIEAHAYRITTPDGQTGDYFYENDICVRVVTKTMWATVITQLVSKNLAMK